MPERSVQPLDLEAVAVEDGFWSEWVETAREELLDYQYRQLEDSGTLENFRRAAAGEQGGFQGMWFQDSDAYKWLEAASYALATGDDPELRERVDEVIGLVADAQREDGYLDTYFQLVEPDRRWTNLNMMHELYCGGHLIEAAVAHYEATGDEALLDVARAFADHVDRTFPDEVDGAPGHEEIELALVRLARATGESRYLDLAAYFVEKRGRDDRFEWEFEHAEEIAGYDDGDGIVAGARGVFYEDDEYDGRYAQAHRPVREQEAVEGHSVRATYLYAAVADLAMETDDEELLEVADRLWRNMTEKRAYVTGGIGSEPAHEGFTEDYDLPNDTAYAETCAAIGSVFWSQRMFEATGEGRFHDLIERQLYNAVLVGTSLDATEFFYQNVLESDGDFHRSGWFECACCPPNLARLLASLGQYCYAAGDDALYVNQYVGGSARATVADTPVAIEQESGLPWDGTVTLSVDAVEPTEFALRLRVPEWCPGYEVTVDGEAVDPAVEDGYLTLDRRWTDHRVELAFETPVRRLRAHPAVEADAGRVALQRGPIVYCVEDVDLDRPPHQHVLPRSAAVEAEHRADLLGGVTVLEADATVPDLDPWDGELYLPDEETDSEAATLTAVPYYAWDNREAGPMAVWLRAE